MEGKFANAHLAPHGDTLVVRNVVIRTSL